MALVLYFGTLSAKPQAKIIGTLFNDEKRLFSLPNKFDFGDFRQNY